MVKIRTTIYRIKRFSGNIFRKCVVVLCIIPILIFIEKIRKNKKYTLKENLRFILNESVCVVKKTNDSSIYNKIVLFLFSFGLCLYNTKSITYTYKYIYSYLKNNSWYDFSKYYFLYNYKNQDSLLWSEISIYYSHTVTYIQRYPSACVIIPVYNGIEYLRSLIPSILEKTPNNVKFIIVDDASTDLSIRNFLSEATKAFPHCHLVFQDDNVGFVKTVNHAMTLVNTDIAVLLNTDVVVPENWIQRILYPFTIDSNIASATPFTNSAVYFSFPQVGVDNELPDTFTVQDIDAAFASIRPDDFKRNRVHSGVGFCMAVNIKCWNKIGPFDSETFGKGYGEETDWCMRADSFGWKNVLVPNLFVYHKHGGSFAPEEKSSLCTKHLEILEKRWPDQMKAVHLHELGDPWRPYRALAALLLANTGEKCLLLVDWYREGSGAYEYRIKKTAFFEDKGWNVVLLTYKNESDIFSLHTTYLSTQFEIIVNMDELEYVFDVLKIKHVFINNIAFYSFPESFLEIMVKLKKYHSFCMEYVFHDFLCICPSFFLLDKNNTYCRGGDYDKCKSCIQFNSNATLSRKNIEVWRNNWIHFFNECDNLYCFSEYSNTIITSILKISKKIHVVEHQPLNTTLESTWSIPSNLKPPYTLCFIGNFYTCKGRHIVMELADIIQNQHIPAQIVVFGDNPDDVRHDVITFHGRYCREQLPILVNKYSVSAALFTSICPETFSYVAQEIMQMKLPFVCFNLGAPPERIKKYKYKDAEIAQEISAKGIMQALDKLFVRKYGFTLFERKK